MSSFFSSWKKSLSTSTLLPTDEPLSSLPPHEQSALSELLTRAQPLLATAHPNDAMTTYMKSSEEACRQVLLKYLRARSLNITRALEMFSQSLQWRRKKRVEHTRLKMLYDERAGCPVNVLPVKNEKDNLLVYACMRYHEKKKLSYDCYFEALIAALEHMFYREEGGHIDQIVLLLDFENWSPVTNVDLTVLKESMLIVFGNYPERLSSVFLVNYPVAIYGVYRVIEPIMDMRTRKRIHWVKPISTLRNLLYEHFNPDQLPEWLCGTKQGVSPNLTIKELHEETLRLKFCTV